jgi:hypothetical protein
VTDKVKHEYYLRKALMCGGFPPTRQMSFEALFVFGEEPVAMLNCIAYSSYH